MNQPASALRGLEGERVALCDVEVSAVLQDLLAEVTVSQTYRNDERANIEAVYTFPLPLDAVLLDLEVDIGGRVLTGVVVEKEAAEEDYEDAVEAGDAAVMLEAIEPGLYTMNVGNLLPQETAKITFRYAILYRLVGDRLRFYLPTTIAPRYGESPHLPHQAPEASLTVENRFSLRVEVLGALRDAQFVCPSHAIELAKSPESVVLSLRQPKAVMDRDFILNVKAPQATRSFVLCGKDGEGMTAIASFQPFFPGLRQPGPLTLAIVVDCSGSMEGDSMEQAKQALDGILERLQAQDRVALIAFGSSTKALSRRLLPCSEANLANARRFASSLNADMGGTDIGTALREAYAAIRGTEAADLFLVTDGEVSDWESVIDEATKSGHRIFTVGVGSAVSEAFVQGLASATRGECELVSPREGMADRVVRHFERMRAPRAKRMAVHWPDGAANISPSRIGAVFEGDTVVASATFARSHPSGNAILEVETNEGEIFRQGLTIPAASPASPADGLSTVARVAAAARLKGADDVAGLQTALRYRLVSPWTNWLVVAPRAEGEKARDIPALRKVQQTLAAGWGGVGSVSMKLSLDSMVAMSVSPQRDSWEACSRKRMAVPDFDFSAIQALRPVPVDLLAAYRRLIELVEADASRLDFAGALDMLNQSGLAAEFDEVLRDASDLGLSVGAVAAVVLARFIGGSLGVSLSGDAQAALATLQVRAQEATDELRKMGRRDVALALDRLDDAVQRSEVRLQRELARHAHRTGGAIA
jgi:Ca-activated chloride channel family protein